MKKLYTTLVIALLSIHSFAQAPNWAWAKSAGGIDNDQSNSIAIDAAGNTYITGSFASTTITFGGTTLTNNGSNSTNDVFIAKYDANGNVIWAKSAGGIDYDDVESIATDLAGNIYIIGGFRSPTITFGTTTLSNIGTANVFVVKFDSNGNVIWAKSANGTLNSFVWGNGIAIDAAGNASFTGYFGNTNITFGTTTLTNNSIGINNDVFIAKYDTNGNVLWAKSAGGTSDDFGRSISVDASGNSYITGVFSSPTITFGATTLTNNNSNDTADIFITKYDTNGNVNWAKSIGGTGDDYSRSIATNAVGNSYITGFFTSPSITFGTTTLTNNGSADILIAKYDANGNVVWAKSSGGNADDYSYSIAIDEIGNAFITGAFLSPIITFGATTLTNNGNYDIFVTKYDSNGNVLWAQSTGSIYGDFGGGIATETAGNTYITGAFQSPTITFGATTLTNNELFDIFIAKLGGTTGIAEMEKGETVLLAPNPFTSQLSISFNEAQKNTSIKLMNTLGECIQQLTTSNQQLILDMSGLARGMYFVQITDADKNVVNKKVIKE